MTQDTLTRPVKFISLIDEYSTDLSLFQELYLPKYSTQENIQSLEINIFDTQNDNNYYRYGPRLQNAFVRPTLSSYDYRVNHVRDGESYNLSRLIHQIDSRLFYRTVSNRGTSKLTNDISLLYNIDKLYQYNLTQHQSLINDHKYLPLLFDKSFIKNNLPRNINPSTRDFNQEAYESFILWLDSVEFVYWKKTNGSFVPDSGPFQDQTIFSMFSEGIFKKFNNDILNVDADQNVFELSKPYNPHSLSTRRAQNRGYWRTANSNVAFNYDVNSPEMCINTHEFGDISFLNDSTFSQTSEELTLQHNTLPYLINNVFPKKRINVIKVPSWKSKSNDTEIEFTSYTKGQFLKRQTSLAAIVYQYPVFDLNSELTKINYFSLVSNASHLDLETKSRVNERMVTLFDKLFWNDGVKLYDPSKAQLILDELFQGLNRYTNKLLESIPQTSLSQLSSFQTDFKPFETVHNHSLTMKPKVDINLENKFKKISLNFEKHSEKLAYNHDNHRYLSTSLSSLKTQMEYLRKAKEELKRYIDINCESINSIYTSAQFIKRNKAIHESISNKYNSAYEESLMNRSYHSDSFFENLANDQIKILKITYFSEGSRHKIDVNSKADSLTNLIKAQNKDSSFAFVELEFIIDRPVIIKVDSKEDKLHVAGPYLVKVSKENISLKLAYNYSLFGLQNNSYCAHPHTGSTSNLFSLLENWQRGCMGEATTLIYNAFQKNDLKLIVLASMTWITSANSSDAWGRKYDWFLKSSDIVLEDSSEKIDITQDVEEEDVGEFLQALFEQDDEEETLNDPDTENLNSNRDQINQETLTPVEAERWNPQNFTAPQTNYTPLTGVN